MRLVIGVGWVVAALLAPQVSAQGLAAAAERERARRAAQAASASAKNPAGSTTPAGAEEPAPRATGEAYWRERAAQRRSAVLAAEAKLREVEARAAVEGPMTPGPHDLVCQDGAIPYPGESAVVLRDRSRGARTCDDAALGQVRVKSAYAEIPPAKEALERARQALASLDEEARKAGAQPGWIR